MHSLIKFRSRAVCVLCSDETRSIPPFRLWIKAARPLFLVFNCLQWHQIPDLTWSVPTNMAMIYNFAFMVQPRIRPSSSSDGQCILKYGLCNLNNGLGGQWDPFQMVNWLKLPMWVKYVEYSLSRLRAIYNFIGILYQKKCFFEKNFF